MQGGEEVFLLCEKINKGGLVVVMVVVVVIVVLAGVVVVVVMLVVMIVVTMTTMMITWWHCNSIRRHKGSILPRVVERGGLGGGGRIHSQ